MVKILTLCGLTSQKSNQGSLELSGLIVHEEAHPCMLKLIQSKHTFLNLA